MDKTADTQAGNKVLPPPSFLRALWQEIPMGFGYVPLRNIFTRKAQPHSDGPTVVLGPGFLENKRLYMRVLAQSLSREGFNVWQENDLRLRGFFNPLSFARDFKKSLNLGPDYNALEALENDINSAYEDSEKPVHVVAHSAAGPLMEYLIAESFCKDRIASITLIASPMLALHPAHRKSSILSTPFFTLNKTHPLLNDQEKIEKTIPYAFGKERAADAPSLVSLWSEIDAVVNPETCKVPGHSVHVEEGNAWLRGHYGMLVNAHVVKHIADHIRRVEGSVQESNPEPVVPEVL